MSLFIISLVSNLLMLAGPLFMLQVYDRVLSSRSLPTLMAFVVIITAVYIFYAFIETVRSRMSLRLANLMDHALGEKLFEASVRLRLATGQASQMDPVRDGDSLRAFLAGPGPLALLDMPWVPVYLAVVFVIHPFLGWLAVGGAILGHISLKQVRETGEQGESYAKAGIIVGWIGTGLLILCGIGYIAFFAALFSSIPASEFQ